jgi:hypothetical protein
VSLVRGFDSATISGVWSENNGVMLPKSQMEDTWAKNQITHDKDRRAMYDRFSDKGAHSTEWFQITKDFLKLAFAGDHHEVKCLWNRCRDRRMLSEYEMFGHIAKQGFMMNYLVWHQNGEVQAPIVDKLDGNDDEDQMDDMVANIDL